jgi:hypothetical protein
MSSVVSLCDRRPKVKTTPPQEPKTRMWGIFWTPLRTALGRHLMVTAPDLSREPTVDPNGDEWMHVHFLGCNTRKAKFIVAFRQAIIPEHMLNSINDR